MSLTGHRVQTYGSKTLNQAESGRYEIHQMYGSHVARDITLLRTVQMVGLWYVAAPKDITSTLPSHYSSKNVKSSWFARPF